MKKITVLLLVLLLLAGCGDKTESVSLWDYEVIPQADQNQAMAANDALLEAYDWDGSLETVDVMPKDYAGRYIDEDNVLNILTVAPLRDVLETYTEACGTRNIRLQEAEYSYFDLSAAMDALDEYNSTHDVMLCYSWGIDEMNNTIQIVISPDMEEAAKTLQEQHPCIRYQVEKPELEPVDHTMYTEIDEVTLELAEQTLEGVYFSVINNSAMEMQFGSVQTLDVLIDGVWYAIPYRSDIAFVDVLYGTLPGESREITAWLPAWNYEMVPGTYRIGQPYCLGEYAPTQGKDFDHIAYLVFEIQDTLDTD